MMMVSTFEASCVAFIERGISADLWQGTTDHNSSHVAAQQIFLI